MIKSHIIYCTRNKKRYVYGEEQYIYKKEPITIINILPIIPFKRKLKNFFCCFKR